MSYDNISREQAAVIVETADITGGQFHLLSLSWDHNDGVLVVKSRHGMDEYIDHVDREGTWTSIDRGSVV